MVQRIVVNGNAGKRILPVNREVRKKSVPLLNERKFEVEETDGVPSHFQLKVNVRIVGFKVFEERASFIGGAAPNKKYIVHISPPGPNKVSTRVGSKNLRFEAIKELGPPIGSPSGNRYVVPRKTH